MMAATMRRFKNHPSPLVAQDSRSPLGVPSSEIPVLHNHNGPSSSVQIISHNPSLTFNNLEAPKFEEEISAGIDNETKEKVVYLERQLKRIKGTDSLGSVNFSELCITQD